MLIRMLIRYRHLQWAFADQALISAANFFTGVLLARQMGIYEFGRFSLAWMVVLFATAAQQAVIIAPMMSIGPKQQRAEQRIYFGAAMLQQVVFAFAVFAVVMIGVGLSTVVYPEWQAGRLALPLAVAAFTCQLQNFMRRYFFTRGYSVGAFLSDSIRYISQVFLLTCLVRFDLLNSINTLWIISGSAIASVIVGSGSIRSVDWDFDAFWATSKRHWVFSRWLLGSALMQWMSANLFILAAGMLLSASAVGALKATQNIVGVIHILFFGLENVVPSQAGRCVGVGGPRELIRYLKNVTYGAGLATALAAAVIIVVPQFWLQLFYGDQYVGFGSILQWYAVIYVIIVFEIPLTAGLRALENTWPIFQAGLAAAVFTAVSIYPLITVFGLFGVMIGIFTVNLLRQILLLVSIIKCFR